MKVLNFILPSLCAVMLLASGASAATIIDDFSGGVTAVSHPHPDDGGSNAFETWYDITDDSFASAAASTLDSSDAMTINDGGFTNGVYAIYESVVPATGLYNVSVDMLVNDPATSQLTAYQVGVIVNGVHRGPNPSDLATFSGAGTAVGNYSQTLTSESLDPTTKETVSTSTFSANAGDNLLIGFSTDLDTGDFDDNAGFWRDAFVQVDNIMLNPIPEPSSAILLSLAGLGLATMRRRR